MLRTLLLYASYTNQMSYFNDWIDAFEQHPSYQTICLDVLDPSNNLNQIKKFIETIDLIVLHHSMNGDTLNYLKPLLSALKNRRGKLVSFVGNEINLPTVGMASKIKILQELETDIIATQLLQEAGEWLYAECSKSQIVSLPHALNQKAFYPRRAYNDRKIDIGTRSARYSVYMGDNMRNNILNFFSMNAKKFGLSVDLGLEGGSQKRFTRSEWADFLSSCKATLSTEAGSFYLEKDDAIVKNIQECLRKKSTKIVLPHETFARKAYRRIVPSFIRKAIVFFLKDRLIEADSTDQDCDFNEVYEKFFSTAKKAPVYTKAISSRHFDAIGTKTLHIMYPGRYNDILKPGEHYFELQVDHSNIEELIMLFQNSKKVEEITSHAYDYVIKNHTHKNRLDFLLEKLA